MIRHKDVSQPINTDRALPKEHHTYILGSLCWSCISCHIASSSVQGHLADDQLMGESFLHFRQIWIRTKHGLTGLTALMVDVPLSEHLQLLDIYVWASCS